MINITHLDNCDTYFVDIYNASLNEWAIQNCTEVSEGHFNCSCTNNYDILMTPVVNSVGEFDIVITYWYYGTIAEPTGGGGRRIFHYGKYSSPNTNEDPLINQKKPYTVAGQTVCEPTECGNSTLEGYQIVPKFINQTIEVPVIKEVISRWLVNLIYLLLGIICVLGYFLYEKVRASQSMKI